MDDDAIDELRSAIARIARRLRAENADDQLGSTQLTVVMLLAREGPHTLSALSDFVRVTPPSMNQTVNSLESLGFVQREPDPNDGRKVLVVATKAGLAYANETSRRRHEWLSMQLEGISDADRRALIKATGILRRIADA